MGLYKSIEGLDMPDAAEELTMGTKRCPHSPCAYVADTVEELAEHLVEAHFYCWARTADNPDTYPVAEYWAIKYWERG